MTERRFSTWTGPTGKQATTEEWLCPDCGGWHVVGFGGIRVGHPCERTEPPADPDLLKTFREQGEPAPMYCAHMGNDGSCLHEDCQNHTCHLGDLECEAVQEYVRNQPAPRSGT